MLQTPDADEVTEAFNSARSEGLVSLPQLLQPWSALADTPFSRSDNILSSYRLFIRKGITNTSSIYDELTMQDADGLGEMDAGVDISGNCYPRVSPVG